jgi:hypothetical protein
MPGQPKYWKDMTHLERLVVFLRDDDGRGAGCEDDRTLGRRIAALHIGERPSELSERMNAAPYTHYLPEDVPPEHREYYASVVRNRAGRARDTR